MSQIIDHDIISKKLESLFEKSRTAIMKQENLTKEQLQFVEKQVKNTEVTLVDDNLIHINDEGQTLSIIKSPEAREYKIYLHENDEDIPVELSRMNLIDDPSVQVYIGRNNREGAFVSKNIDKGLSDLREVELKNTKDAANKTKPKTRSPHRPRR